jgi:hypothetical protein
VRITSGHKISGPSALAGTAEELVYKVSSVEIAWRCGADKNRTVCPEGTNVVKMRRGKDRLVTVQCYRK